MEPRWNPDGTLGFHHFDQGPCLASIQKENLDTELTRSRRQYWDTDGTQGSIISIRVPSLISMQYDLVNLDTKLTRCRREPRHDPSAGIVSSGVYEPYTCLQLRTHPSGPTSAVLRGVRLLFQRSFSCVLVGQFALPRVGRSNAL